MRQMELHYYKMSLLFEAIANEGIASLKEKMTGVLLKYESELVFLSKDNFFKKFSIYEEQLSNECRLYMNSNGIDVMYSKLLRNTSNEIYGLMELHFDKPPNKDFFLDKESQIDIMKLYDLLNNQIIGILKKKK